MARPYEIAKAGWLQRQTSVLKRWKRNWFVLYQNGDLKYFENPDSHVPEECIVVRAECTNILTGKQIESLSPPEGRPKENLLQLKLRTGEINLCADSVDDMRTWQVLLEDARVMRNPPPANAVMGAPPPYPGAYQMPPPPPVAGYPPTAPYPPQQVTAVNYPRQQVTYAYPGQVVYGANTVPYAYPPGPQTTIVYTDNDYRRRHGLNGDMATGFVAGAALGTMMWTPMLFW
ncbi:pleckstrin homology domain-containing family B member 2-like [Liolophura sinensis]|uniref:pleckstrin homology domain-containing family B member 2-like n=1 Tax=Liolophura sinensis TaxID=3198878 RepID=UPI0031584A58